MQTVTLDVAARQLKSIINKIIRNKEETIIAVDEGAVVLIEESEWGHIQEMLRLLSDKNSLSALMESHAIRDRSQTPEGIAPEEAFGTERYGWVGKLGCAGRWPHGNSGQTAK